MMLTCLALFGDFYARESNIAMVMPPPSGQVKRPVLDPSVLERLVQRVFNV